MCAVPTKPSSPSRPLRILYAAGPGDVLGTYRHWKEGRDDPSQVAKTYSGQFYDVCRQLGAQALVIAARPAAEPVEDGPFRFESRPTPGRGRGGWAFHWGQVLAARRLVRDARRMRADVAIISEGSCHWFALGALSRGGVKVIPTMHCVLWPRRRPPRGFGRIVQALNARFFRSGAAAILSLSEDITEQLMQITRGRHRPIFAFLPAYRPESFAGLAPPPQSRNPFRVLYAGRIETDKGVFQLLDLARQFERQNRRDIEFDLCGDGAALELLRRQAAEAGLAARFRCHGYCQRDAMRKMYQQSHVVIAPTTGDFIEGFNKVVAEGVLAGRPVVTSSVCPALQYVRPAVVEVPADDPAAYGRAILQLCDDPQLFEAHRQGCQAVQAQFYDPDRSWSAALTRALAGFCQDSQG